MRMLVPGTANEVKGDRYASLAQPLGLRQTVRGLKQLRQVVEADGDVGMLGPEAVFVDGQGATHKGLGLRQPVRGLKQLRQVVEADGDLGMVGSEALFVDGQ